MDTRIELEKTMKNIFMILFVVTLLVVASLGQQTAPLQADVNWLDAPTPDGSPTLRETSDWLGKTLSLYGGFHDVNGGSTSTWGKMTDNVSAGMIVSAHIDG